MPALKQKIAQYILDLGFDAVGFCRPQLTPAQIDIRNQLTQEQCGHMDWLWNTHQLRNNPQLIFPEAQTAIVVASHLGQAPYDDRYRGIRSRYAACLNHKNLCQIAQYAKAQKDYHIWIKKDLKNIIRFLHKEYNAQARPYVDTAPLAERLLAANAGLGWIGKNTLLISPRFGAKLMLGVILTDMVIEADSPMEDGCHRCTACQKACPTKALNTAYRLDIPKCISYLTIEHRGEISHGLTEQIGNHFFGCDECSAVCPHNKKAPPVQKWQNMPRMEMENLQKDDFLKLSEEEFHQIFAGSALKRAGYNRLKKYIAKTK